MTSPTPEPGNDAYTALVEMLQRWGLASLATDVLDLLTNGYTQDQVVFMLQETPAYRQRFAANEVRRNRGLPVLSPAEYLATEDTYRQIMREAGMPPGFYDQTSDFQKFLENDVSPSEVQSRVSYAQVAANDLDPGTKSAFLDLYGLSSDDLTAYFLDAERAMPELQKAARGSRIAGAASGYGVQVSREQADRFAMAADDNYEQQANMFAERAAEVGRLSNIYGGQYGIEEAGQDVFSGSTEAERKRKRLVAQEEATFSADSGVGSTSLEKAPQY